MDLNKIQKASLQLTEILQLSNMEVIEFSITKEGMGKFMIISTKKDSLVQLGDEKLLFPDETYLERMLSFIDGYYQAWKKYKL